MKEPLCPLIKKPCMGHGCMFYTRLSGKHPQTGADIDELGCAIVWLPILLIEGAQKTRGVQAAVESMRNEVVKRQDDLNAAVQIGVRHENHPKRLADGSWVPTFDVEPRE